MGKPATGKAVQFQPFGQHDSEREGASSVTFLLYVREGLELLKPLGKMPALGPDGLKTNIQCSNIPHKYLLVSWAERHDCLGGGSLGRIVDVLRRAKRVSDGLKVRGYVNASNALRQDSTIAEKKSLEFVHDHERDEPAPDNRCLHVRTDIIRKCLLNGFCLSVRGRLFGLRPPGQARSPCEGKP